MAALSVTQGISHSSLEGRKTGSKVQITGGVSVLKVNKGTIYELKVPPLRRRHTKEISDIFPAAAAAAAPRREQTHPGRCAGLVAG